MNTSIIEYETERITNQLWLLENADFVLEALDSMRRTKDSHTVDEVFKTICRHLGSEEFGVWVQRADGELVALSVNHIGYDIYGGKEGVAWLLFCSPRANRQQIDEAVIVWLHRHGCNTVTAVDVDYTKGKSRWFEKAGFKERFRVFERSI